VGHRCRGEVEGRHGGRRRARSSRSRCRGRTRGCRLGGRGCRSRGSCRGYRRCGYLFGEAIDRLGLRAGAIGGQSAPNRVLEDHRLQFELMFCAGAAPSPAGSGLSAAALADSTDASGPIATKMAAKRAGDGTNLAS